MKTSFKLVAKILSLNLVLIFLCGCAKSSTNSLSTDEKSSRIDVSSASAYGEKTYGFSPHCIDDEFYSNDGSAHYVFNVDFENHETALPTRISKNSSILSGNETNQAIQLRNSCYVCF